MGIAAPVKAFDFFKERLKPVSGNSINRLSLLKGVEKLCSARSLFGQFYPYRSMVAGFLPTPYIFIHACCYQLFF
jgi:hypothetical protein